MLTDEHVIEQVRTRLRSELAALEPEPDLVARLRTRAVARRQPRASVAGLRRRPRRRQHALANPGADRRPASILGNTGMVLSVLATVAILVIALVTLHHRSRASAGGGGASSASLADPPSFVTVRPEGGSTAVLELRSPETGRVEKVLARLRPHSPAGAFYSEGVALSPDGGEVYLASPPATPKRPIERIDVANGRRTVIAHGQQPAISPTGRLLAYAEPGQPSRTIAIRNLVSGTTSSIQLASVLGTQTDLSYGVLAWLDAQDIVLAPGQMASNRPYQRVVTQSRRGTCTSAPPADACLAIVHLTPTGQAPSVQLMFLPNVNRTIAAIVSDTAHPHSLLLATSTPRSPRATPETIIDRVTLSGHAATVHRINAPQALTVMAFDLTGRHVLYLGSDPSAPQFSQEALWSATISNDRLTNPHQLIANAEVQETAW